MESENISQIFSFQYHTSNKGYTYCNMLLPLKLMLHTGYNTCGPIYAVYKILQCSPLPVILSAWLLSEDFIGTIYQDIYQYVCCCFSTKYTYMV